MWHNSGPFAFLVERSLFANLEMYRSFLFAIHFALFLQFLHGYCTTALATTFVGTSCSFVSDDVIDLHGLYYPRDHRRRMHTALHVGAAGATLAVK